MPPFKDEHILIIAPGSQTTLAQLGLPESFTPASHRFPTRMFRAPDGKTWEPNRIVERLKINSSDDTVMNKPDEEQEKEPVEYPDEDEDAVWPLKRTASPAFCQGRIENLPAFFALLQHIHNTLSPSLHTPILLVGQPCWTAKNHEDITQFVFEKFKTPGLCIIDSAIATTYAFATANATVIDVGFEKTDITAIIDFSISARGTVEESGGEGMTRRLIDILKEKNFTRDMAEQLKKSPICEILSPGTPLPGTTDVVIADESLIDHLPTAVSSENSKVTEIGQEKLEDKLIDNDGVLDIATIVTSGKTQDFLAKKEKEKLERAAARKATRDAEKAEATAAVNKLVKLPNSKRPRAIFHYEESIKNLPNLKNSCTPESQHVSNAAMVEATNTEDASKIASTSESTALVEDDVARKEQQKTTRKEEKRKSREDDNPYLLRRDIEVGTERFQAAENGYMDAIADAVYRTILSIDDISKRQDAWESLILCGMGSKVRGFKDALLGTLNSRYLVTPSSASIFINELPSNLGTPAGNGAMTPIGSLPSHIHAPPTATAVNPLLLAATSSTISNSYNSFQAATPIPQQNNRSQSPSSIKFINPPTYFPEWKQYEEAVFLGSQVAAKVLFVNDQGQSKGFLSRMEYNEDGPTAIHQV
ncbi:hypothetical protein Golomagni_02118 [Golovinomyces magnicellulatus]|nr:hypothetical protein Golomagni_02118 [Golovinomyces magnicellulatus]